MQSNSKSNKLKSYNKQLHMLQIQYKQSNKLTNGKQNFLITLQIKKADILT